jgi:ADP-heptose:LPS heptosyltransferase
VVPLVGIEMERPVRRKTVLGKKRIRPVPRQPQILQRKVRVDHLPDTLWNFIDCKTGNVKICVYRRLGGIGDVLMITPALRQIKADFPNCVLHFAVDRKSTGRDIYYELVKNAPFLDAVLDQRYTREEDYDRTQDISHVCIRYERKGLPVINRIDLFARALGIPKLDNTLPFYQVEYDEFLQAQSFCVPLRKSQKKLVGLHTASMEGKRCWPAKKYYDLIRIAQKENPDYHFVIFDHNSVCKGIDRYDNCTVVGDIEIRLKFALIAQLDCFLGPDSGLMHIAGALHIPTVVVFGSIPPMARINYYPSHRELRTNNMPCLGCWYTKCDRDAECMQKVTAKMALKEINTLIIK